MPRSFFGSPEGTAAPSGTTALATAAPAACIVASGHSTRLTVRLIFSIGTAALTFTRGTHAVIVAAAARVAVDHPLIGTRPVTWLSSTAIGIRESLQEPNLFQMRVYNVSDRGILWQRGLIFLRIFIPEKCLNSSLKLFNLLPL